MGMQSRHHGQRVARSQCILAIISLGIICAATPEAEAQTLPVVTIRIEVGARTTGSPLPAPVAGTLAPPTLLPSLSVRVQVSAIVNWQAPVAAPAVAVASPMGFQGAPPPVMPPDFPMPYNPGVERPRQERPPGGGLIAAGAAMFGASYGIGVIVGLILLPFDIHTGGTTSFQWLFVPGIGPFASAIDHAGRGQSDVVPILVIDGLIQAGGLAALIAGGVMRQRGRSPQWAVNPVAAGATVGASVIATF